MTSAMRTVEAARGTSWNTRQGVGREFLPEAIVSARVALPPRALQPAASRPSAGTRQVVAPPPALGPLSRSVQDPEWGMFFPGT